MFVLLSVLSLSLANAQPADPAGAPTAQAVAASEELKPGERKVKLVCKKRAASGTRFPKTSCMELDAYKRQADLDRAAFEEIRGRNGVVISKGD